MTMPTDETLERLNSLNDWLKVIYDSEMQLSDLLANASVSPEKIDEILMHHLSRYLDAVIYYLRNVITVLNASGRNEVMLRHYGLVTGKKEDFYLIGHEFGVAGERIRQIVMRCINQLKNEQFKSDFERELVRLVDVVLKQSD